VSTRVRRSRLLGLAVSVLGASGLVATAHADGEWLPTGQTVTPTAAPGSFLEVLGGDRPVGQATSLARSPDGRTLAVLTSGFNRHAQPDGEMDVARSLETLFIYDLASGRALLRQAMPLPNTFVGLAFAADGQHLYVSGGRDDVVHVFGRIGPLWTEDSPALALGNGPGLGLVPRPADVEGAIPPLVSGVASTADGRRLVVANYENDSVGLIDLATRTVRSLDLRPGKSDVKDRGVPGGEFPFDVVVRGNDLAFVSSVRDREVVVVDLGATTVRARIPVRGNPNHLLLDRAGRFLYVAVDQTDRVEVIDTQTLKIVGGVTVRTAAALHRDGGRPGASPNGLALSPDERTLYVTLGGENAVAVVAIDAAEHEYELKGTIPTAWYPNAVVTSLDGRTLYVANSKSPIGPNVGNCTRSARPDLAPKGCPPDRVLRTSGDYALQRLHAGLGTIPVPDGAGLLRLTQQVAKNNALDMAPTAREREVVAALRRRIRHVVYIVKENRTYDQVLGDVAGANGDPNLTQFGRVVTPNLHALATRFVTLDAFYCSGEVSMQGWQWSVGARTVDINEKTTPVNYGKRGASYDAEGTSRNINVALPMAERFAADPAHVAYGSQDPDLLPGPRNEMELDGPSGEPGLGYLWDAALRAKKTVRNYGFYVDLSRYDLPATVEGAPIAIPPLHDPRATNTRVAFAAHPSLVPLTDPYFRSFDTKLPDFWRYREWVQEFDGYERRGDLPTLSLVRFMNDHTGSFKAAIDGVNTPELQIADNDYAVGLLVERIAHSRYAKDTLVFIVEDDAQDGPDHVDAHRSPAFIVGPYVRQGGVVVSTRYTTVNLIRTIEAVLGLEALNARDAVAAAMSDVFDLSQRAWTFEARPSALLRTTALPLPPPTPAETADGRPVPLHDAEWWAAVTATFDLTRPDAVDADAFNRVLWAGTMGARPYPEPEGDVP